MSLWGERPTKKAKTKQINGEEHTQIYAKVDDWRYRYEDDDSSVGSHEIQSHYHLDTHHHFEFREREEVELYKRSKIAPTSYWDEIKESYHETITMEYWLSLGRGQEYASQMMSLQKKIENCTRKLIRHFQDWAPRYTEYPMSIILAPDLDNNNGRIYPIDPTYGRTVPFLQYDVKLLSRFETFFKAMGGSRCWGTLRVTSFEFPKVLFDLLAKTMLETREYRTHYYIMRFESNQFGIEELQHLPKVLDAIVYHAHLYFSDNAINSLEAAGALASAIHSCKQLKEVHIRCCGIGNDPKILQSILHGCSNVNLLRIDLNTIQSDGAATVSDFIASNPCIKRLILGPEYIFSQGSQNHVISSNTADNRDISTMYSNVDESERNKFNGSDAVLFSNTLWTNTNLQVLTLPNTCFQLSDLGKAFFDTSSLNAVFASNHTCRIVNNMRVQPMIKPRKEARGPREQGWYYDRKEILALPEDSAELAKWKVLKVLSSALQTSQSQSIGSYFDDDIQVELFPSILEMVQGADPSFHATPLTLVFELMRSVEQLKDHLEFLTAK